jgi:hypothetical protein
MSEIDESAETTPVRDAATLAPERQRDLPWSRNEWALGGLLLGGSLSVLVLAWGGDVFCLDDAYIHLAYARSFREGVGLSYNPGDWESGASSQLWLALLVLLPFDLRSTFALKSVGALLHLAATAIDLAALRNLYVRHAASRYPMPLWIAAGINLALIPDLMQGATSGMEVPLARLGVSAMFWAVIERRWLVAAGMAAMAGLARPECFVVCAFFSLWPWHREADGRARWRVSLASPAQIATLAGTVFAIAAWSGQALLLTHSLQPNPLLVKGALQWRNLGDQLHAFLESWPFWQPTMLSIAGLTLIAGGLRKNALRPVVIGLIAALTLAIFGVLCTREIHSGILFFERRYFAPFAALPTLAMALALPWWFEGSRSRRYVGLALYWIVTGVAALSCLALATQKRREERSIDFAHVAPARWVAANLPSDAVIAVEGAGALRFFTPRTQTIVDVLGLNDRSIALAGDSFAKVCAIAAKHPTHFVLPAPIYSKLEPFFRWREIARFEDPRYSLVATPYVLQIIVSENQGLREAYVRRCQQPVHLTGMGDRL